jgi:ferredoxin
MKKVVIEPGCITCGACEYIAPQIFEVTDICHVKNKVDLSLFKEEIRQAALSCPVNVIKIQE